MVYICPGHPAGLLLPSQPSRPLPAHRATFSSQPKFQHRLSWLPFPLCESVNTKTSFTFFFPEQLQPPPPLASVAGTPMPPTVSSAPKEAESTTPPALLFSTWCLAPSSPLPSSMLQRPKPLKLPAIASRFSTSPGRSPPPSAYKRHRDAPLHPPRLLSTSISPPSHSKHRPTKLQRLPPLSFIDRPIPLPLVLR
jgi:hypothetical protein